MIIEVWHVIYCISFAQCIFYFLRFTRTQADYLGPSSIFSLTLVLWFYPKIPDLANRTTQGFGWNIDRFLIFWLLCQTAFYVAIHHSPRLYRNIRTLEPNFYMVKEKAWIGFTTFCFLVGATSFFLLTRLPPDMLYMRQPSGIITVYIFFSQFLNIACIVSLFLFAFFRKRFYLIFILSGSLLYLDRIVFHAQRSVLFELIFILLVLFILALGKRLSRPLLLAFALLMLVFNASITDIRPIVKAESRDFRQLENVPVLERLADNSFTADHDMVNAVYAVELKSRPGQQLDLGVSYWNSIVSLYVPAQFLGESFKRSLMLRPGREMFPTERIDYRPPTGSTVFIAGRLFLDFGWFGFFPLYLYAVIMNRLYLKAKQKSLVDLILYAFYGAQIPIVIIFGMTRFTSSFVLWGVVFYWLGKKTVSTLPFNNLFGYNLHSDFSDTNA